MPDGYGIPDNHDDLLPWSFVEERMAEAKQLLDRHGQQKWAPGGDAGVGRMGGR